MPNIYSLLAKMYKLEVDMNTKLFLLASSACFLFFSPQLHSIDPFKTDVIVTQEKGVKATDFEVVNAVKNAFSGDTNLSKFTNAVKVEFTQGVVTLSGKVDSDMVKKEFEAKARSVSGVKEVVNNIEVSPTMSPS